MKKLSAYDRVEIARSQARPVITDYIEKLFCDFTELKGDRLGKEDASILGGIAFFHDIPVTVIGHRKGKNLDENLKFNFGMPGPEGYRKALRLMEQAEKFNRPIITFIDTPGAYPGLEAEENGQGIAIAKSIARMSSLKVPVVAIVTGEGNSGGALALAVANEVWMFENAVYSILSPEGFASILWKDSKRAKEASKLMKMTAGELYQSGFVDKVLKEPEGGVLEESEEFYKELDEALYEKLKELSDMSPSKLKLSRFEKFRKMC